MQDFIKWVVDNWQFVSTTALGVVGFILLLIFKKKPQSNIFNFLREIVEETEMAEYTYLGQPGKQGVNKLWVVVEDFLGKHPEFSRSQVKEIVDLILKAPTSNEDFKKD